MKVYAGTFTIDANNQGGFDVQEFIDGILFTDVICKGTNFGSAAIMQNTVSQFLKTVVSAIWVDASNHALVLPVLTAKSEIDILVNAPPGETIILFAPSGEQFVGGASSITLNPGDFKTFRRFRFNSVAGKDEWAFH